MTLSYLFTFVFANRDSSHDLLVRQLSGYDVISRERPGSEELATEVESPRATTLAHALLLCCQLTFGNCIHDSVKAVTQTRDLK